MARFGGRLKLLGALALLCALGAAAAALALRAFFPEPKLRALIVDGARKQLGREVALEHVSLGLTGLTLEGLRVSEGPGFPAGDFLTVRRFHLRPSWRALLKKKLVVSSVSAEGLKAAVRRRADGTLNVSSLAAASSAPPAEPSAPAAARPEFSIRRASLRGAELSYRDEKAGQAWTASEADLSVDGFAMNAPFGLEGSLRLRGQAGGRPLDARLSFGGEVDPARGELAKLKVKAKRFSAEAEGLTLKGSADIAGLEPPQARFEAALSGAGRTLLEASGEVRLSSAAGGDFLADLKARSAGGDTTLLAKWLPPGSLPALAWPAAELTLKAQRRGAELRLRDLSLRWEGGRVDGQAAAKGLGTAAPSFDGRLELDLALPSVAKGQYPFLKLPPELSLPASKLRGTLELSGDSARLGAFRVTVPQGSVSVDGALTKLGSAKPRPDLTARLDLALPSLKAGELPVQLPPAVPPSFALPAVKVEGSLAVKGEDVRFEDLKLDFAAGRVTLGGALLGALGASPRPEVEAQAKLALQPLADKDLPFPGVPPGLKLPATEWELDLDYTLERLRVRSMRLRLGANDIALEGTVGDPAGRMAYDLLVKARRLLFSELTALTPATRELELKGSAFAALSVTGSGARPLFAGKAQFKDFGATLAGLPLSEFTGTVSFDERRLDLPDLRGRLGDGRLQMDLTVKDFSASPELTLEATLDRFDLGRFLEAKKRYSAEHPAKTAGGAKPGAPAAAVPPLRSRGSLSVGSLQHPQAAVSDLKLSWDLSGIGADTRRLNGALRFSTGGGRLRSAKEMGEQNPGLKVLMLPLTVIQGLARLVGGFPDLSNIAVRSISGDYAVSNGVMAVRESLLDSAEVRASAAGSVDLPKEALDLVVTAQVGRVAPMDVEVRGTLSEPKTKLKIGKFIGDALQGTLQQLLKKPE